MGKFEVYNDKSGEFRFRLKAGNGQSILASEGYTSKAGCDNGIDSVRLNGQLPERFEKKETATGFRFNLKAGNGQIIGTSQNYASEAARDNGIESVMKNVIDADIVLE